MKKTSLSVRSKEIVKTYLNHSIAPSKKASKNRYD